MAKKIARVTAISTCGVVKEKQVMYTLCRDCSYIICVKIFRVIYCF